MKNVEQKREFLKLINAGKTQKDAAIIVGVSEKTAGTWAQNLSAARYSKQREEIQTRISKALKDPLTTASDITRLTDAAVKLEKCIDYAMKNAF